MFRGQRVAVRSARTEWPWSCSCRRWRCSVRRALVDAELARLAVQNEWEGLVIYGAVRQVDDLEELDIGIQAMAAIPVGAAGEGIGESDVRVNFGGVTFFSGDHLYADNTGIILSEDPLDIE